MKEGRISGHALWSNSYIKAHKHTHTERFNSYIKAHKHTHTERFNSYIKTHKHTHTQKGLIVTPKLTNTHIYIYICIYI